MVITQSLCTLRCDHTVNLILNGAEDKPMDLFETPIGQVFPDSMRIYRCMMRAGIFTLGDLIGKTENDLTSIRNFGETRLREVKDTLNQYGLKLKEKKA